MTSTHPFDRYFAKHGHYPRLRFDNGVQRLTVEFTPGYIRIRTSPPFSGEVYITANTARAIAKKWTTILNLIRKQDRNFDVPKAQSKQFKLEKSIQTQMRAEKKDRRSTDGQRRRFLAAQRRARRGREQGE